MRVIFMGTPEFGRTVAAQTDRVEHKVVARGFAAGQQDRPRTQGPADGRSRPRGGAAASRCCSRSPSKTANSSSTARMRPDLIAVAAFVACCPRIFWTCRA